MSDPRTSSMAETPPARDPMGGLRLLRLFGVEVRLDWSLIFIFALVMANLAIGVLPVWHPEWPPLGAWGFALAAAVLFFASLLAHELAHAWVGRALGIPIDRVTLFLFGGMAHMKGEPPNPRAELLMAGVGPLVSFAIGLGCTAWGAALAQPLLQGLSATDFDGLQRAIAGLSPGATLLLWLGPLNLLLAAFNLVPGFPLDGGRLLRAALWAVTKDRLKATRWAAGAGQVVAWGLMALGVLNLFGGAVMQGIWLLLIGWFLNNAARSSYQSLLARQWLEDVPVARLMSTRLDRVSPEMTVDELVRDHVMTSEQHAFPVEREGVLLGMVTLDDLRRVDHSRWPATPVREVMTPSEALLTIPPDADAERALEQLAGRDLEQLPVVAGGSLVGMLRQTDLVRWLSLHDAMPRGHRG